MKTYQFFLLVLISFCLASCGLKPREVSPIEYDNMKLGGSMRIQVVDTNNNLETYTGHGPEFGLIYFNDGQERSRYKYTYPAKQGDNLSRPLELSLRNVNVGDTNFLFHFLHDDVSNYYSSRSSNFKNVVKQDTLYRLIDMNDINLEIQFPGFKFRSSARNFDPTSTLRISNLKEKNQPTEFNMTLKAPIYDSQNNIMPCKSISIRVNTFLVP